MAAMASGASKKQWLWKAKRYISLPSMHNYDVKCPYTTFHGGRKHATTNFLFLLILYLGAVPENSPRTEI